MSIDWGSVFGNPPADTSPSGSTTPSGSSQPAGPSQAEMEMMNRLRASYREIVRRWGMRPNKNLLNLIERAVRSQWSSTQFIDQLRHTPEYRKQFSGITWKTGMTEGQYLATYSQYKALAQQIGETFTKKEFAKALKRGVTADLFKDRVDAISAIESYPALQAQLEFELGQKVSKSELVNLAMGMGPKKWEQIWQRAYLTVQLEKVAGIEVVEKGKGEVSTPDAREITRQDMLQIIRQVEALAPGKELEALTGQDFAALGSELRKYKLDYLRRYGLTTKDLLEMELGGPGAARIAEKGQRILAEQEAFYEPRAQVQTATSTPPREPEDDYVQSL